MQGFGQDVESDGSDLAQQGLSGKKNRPQPQCAAGKNQADAGERSSGRDIQRGFRRHGEKAVAEGDQRNPHEHEQPPDGQWFAPFGAEFVGHLGQPTGSNHAVEQDVGGEPGNDIVEFSSGAAWRGLGVTDEIRG